MKRTYALPLNDGRTARIQVGSDLEVDDGLSTITWTFERDGVKASSSCQADDVTDSLATTLSDLSDLPSTAAEPFMRAWLAEQLGVRHDSAIETLLERALPALGNLYRHHPGITRVSKLSPRLYRALREGETPREIAACYWSDDSTRSDGTAFISSLRIGNDLDESRVGLMNLVPAGDHRRRLADVNSPSVWFVPTDDISDITTSLDVPAALQFAEAAIRDPRSRLQLTAARALNLRAGGNNGEAAYRNLLDHVLRSQFSAPRSLVERAIAIGPVGDLPLAQVSTESELRVLAKNARNCLANPAYPWRNRVLHGEVALLVAGDQGTIAAIAAVDPKSGAMLEVRGVRNAAVPPALVTALQERLVIAATDGR
jgi:hypothetical protein